MYRLSRDVELAAAHIAAYIDNHISEQARLENLYNYYKGKNKILSRTFTDISKPNNRISHNYGSYITNMIVGYFMGQSLKYFSDDDKFMTDLKAIFDRNDEQAEDNDIAKMCSIFGRAYELIYLNEDNELSFIPFDTREIIVIYDDTVESNILYVIRHYDVEDIVTGASVKKIEVYTDTQIMYFDRTEAGLIPTGADDHIFGAVPVIEYLNNLEAMGDFETVIPLIDGLDIAVSDTANSMEYFADAYLALTGMSGTDQDDIAKMKQNRVLLLDENGNAEWLIKDINDTYVENYKTRLVDDIHTLACCPRMTKEDFGVSSGVAMRFKLLGLENLCVTKERAFKYGLQQRIRLITAFLNNINGNSYDPETVNISFTRNIPSSWNDIADMISKVTGIVSNETLLSLLPFITNPAAELARKKKETALTPFTMPNADTDSGDTGE